MFSSYYMDRHGFIYPNQKAEDDVPVVVISPEDREQVERLAKAYTLVHNYSGTPWHVIDSLAAALREFANPRPPKPEEPTGLGAVVEAINDNHFVKVAIGTHGWVRANDMSSIDAGVAGCSYRDIDVVRVVWKGVTP